MRKDSIPYSTIYTHNIFGIYNNGFYISTIINYKHKHIMEETTRLKLGGAVITTLA